MTIAHKCERNTFGLCRECGKPMPGTHAEQRQRAADHDMRVQVVTRELDQCPKGAPTALVAERIIYALNTYDEHLQARRRDVPRPTDKSRAYRAGYWLGRRFWLGLACVIAGSAGWFITELMR